MKTQKMNFAYLTLIFACLNLMLTAQDYNPDAHKWNANPDQWHPAITQAELEAAGIQPSCHISKTKAIYTAMQQGDVYSLTPHLGKEVQWNDQYEFPYPTGNPNYNMDGMSEVLFNKIGQGYFNWGIQELTFSESPNNTITVSGIYQANRSGLIVRVPFLHTWTWNGSYVTRFQHYETTQAIAERP